MKALSALCIAQLDTVWASKVVSGFTKGGRISQPERGSFRLRGLAQGDGELRFAFGGGVLEGIAGAVTLGGLEQETVFRAGRESCETGFAVNVGADFEIHPVKASVGNADVDFGVVDGLAAGICDGEVGGTGAEIGVYDGDGVGVGLGVCERGNGQSQCEDN